MISSCLYFSAATCTKLLILKEGDPAGAFAIFLGDGSTCEHISGHAISALVVFGYRLMWLENQNYWATIALKFHPIDLHSYETLAALTALLLNVLDESLQLHCQNQKHSPLCY